MKYIPFWFFNKIFSFRIIIHSLLSTFFESGKIFLNTIADKRLILTIDRWQLKNLALHPQGSHHRVYWQTLNFICHTFWLIINRKPYESLQRVILIKLDTVHTYRGYLVKATWGKLWPVNNFLYGQRSSSKIRFINKYMDPFAAFTSRHASSRPKPYRVECCKPAPLVVQLRFAFDWNQTLQICISINNKMIKI